LFTSKEVQVSNGSDHGSGDQELGRAIRGTGVLIAILAYPASFVLSAVSFDVRSAAIVAIGAVLIVAVAAVVGSYTAAWEIRRSLVKRKYAPSDVDDLYSKLHSRIDQIEGLLAGTRTAFEGQSLQTTEEIAAYEVSCIASEIWVSSRDLALDLSHEEHVTLDTDIAESGETEALSFIEIIRLNLRRGVAYTYLMPDEEHLRAKADQLTELTLQSDQLGRLEFLFITPDEFDRLPYTQGNFAIFNPLRKTKAAPVRISAEYPAGEKQLWMIVTGEPALLWVDRVKPITLAARRRKK
jgi:hypothetical protein